MRQDDNGNRFIVAEALTEAEAHLLSASYSARSHKLLYWVEPMVIEGDPASVEPMATEADPASRG